MVVMLNGDVQNVGEEVIMVKAWNMEIILLKALAR